MNYSEIYKILPKELGDYVVRFNPEHRKNMNYVLDELNDYHTVYCDNDACEAELKKTESIEVTIKLDDYMKLNFCNEYCKSYGLWSIRYDYRKYYRWHNRTDNN
jgi:hypothetical protein